MFLRFLSPSLKPATKVPEIIFVALDITKKPLTANRNSYDYLPAQEKIELLKEVIHLICKKLSHKEAIKEIPSNLPWILSWREHGMSEDFSHFVTDKTRTLFHTTMKKLTSQYKNLVIIAGTLKTKRQINKAQQPDIIKNIQQRYQNLIHLEALENKINQTQLKLHKAEFESKLKDAASHLTIIRNTCFMYPGNYKRSKTAAWQETESNNEMQIYYPGRLTNNVIDLKLHNDEKLNLGLEICYEHFMGLLSHTQAKKVLLHLILSDYVAIQPLNLKGIYNLQIDRIKGTTVVTLDEKPHTEISFYKFDLNEFRLNLVDELVGPLKPENLVEYVLRTHFEGITDYERFIQDHCSKITESDLGLALHHAISVNNLKLITAIINAANVINFIEKDKTPLAKSFEPKVSLDVTKLLLDSKADPAVKNSIEQTAFHVCAEVGNISKLQTLLVPMYSALINKQDKLGQSAAHIAARQGAPLAMMQALFQGGADFEMRDKSGKSTLDLLPSLLRNKFKQLIVDKQSNAVTAQRALSP